jgi:predicted glycosyltransferase
MKILFGVNHPKHIYIFKNVIYNLLYSGHEIRVVAVEKEITLNLLDKFKIPYDVIGKNQPTLMKKIIDLPRWEYNTLKIAQNFKPDIYVGRALPHLAHISALLNKPFLIFEDTENAKLVHKITLPFASSVITPYCYKEDLGIKHIRFDSFFELGYLHPKYFTPNDSILESLELDKYDKFIIVRFVSWKASHDVGQHGFTSEKEIVEKLENYGKVCITSEHKLSKNLEKYRISIPAERMHDLLYYSTMYIGEGAAMASECAVLGTPSIYVNTQTLGYLEELEKNYGLVHNFSNPANAQQNALSKAFELLEDRDIKQKWRIKKERLLNEKIDVTKFITEFIESYL